MTCLGSQTRKINVSKMKEPELASIVVLVKRILECAWLTCDDPALRALIELYQLAFSWLRGRSVVICARSRRRCPVQVELQRDCAVEDQATVEVLELAS